MSEADDEPLRPFLRWAGGKYRLVRRLVPYLPADVQEREYFEPFLGAGALFFDVLPNTAVLGDLNGHLMDCYRAIRSHPKRIARYLATHARRDCEDHYYAIRDKFNVARPSAAQAARFIYLNRTCFNGIFRVNRQGSFNVPYGKLQSPTFPDYADLEKFSQALASAELKTETFEEVLTKAGSEAFVYLDPPYPPLNGTAFFRHYTPDRFGPDDQRTLADTFRALDDRGSRVMLTNADTALIRQLYAGYDMRDLQVTRSISCKAKKHSVSELVIRNYS